MNVSDGDMYGEALRSTRRIYDHFNPDMTSPEYAGVIRSLLVLAYRVADDLPSNDGTNRALRLLFDARRALDEAATAGVPPRR